MSCDDNIMKTINIPKAKVNEIKLTTREYITQNKEEKGWESWVGSKSLLCGLFLLLLVGAALHRDSLREGSSL